MIRCDSIIYAGEILYLDQISAGEVYSINSVIDTTCRPC